MAIDEHSPADVAADLFVAALFLTGALGLARFVARL
jgi:hypothetical protein